MAIINKLYRFEPSINDNKNLPKDQRCYLVVKGISHGKSLEWMRARELSAQYVKSDSIEMIDELLQMTANIAADAQSRVMSVHNAAYETDSGVKTVESVEEFFLECDNSIINELIQFLVNPVESKDIENLELPSSGK